MAENTPCTGFCMLLSDPTPSRVHVCVPSLLCVLARAVDPNPTQQHRKALAERLDLTEEQVQVGVGVCVRLVCLCVCAHVSVRVDVQLTAALMLQSHDKKHPPLSSLAFPCPPCIPLSPFACTCTVMVPSAAQEAEEAGATATTTTDLRGRSS